VNYKLTGHGALTTMHADTVGDAVLRIKEAEAPPEGLDGTLVIQLSAVGGTRFVKGGEGGGGQRQRGRRGRAF
jgi:hypothetical protein